MQLQEILFYDFKKHEITVVHRLDVLKTEAFSASIEYLEGASSFYRLKENPDYKACVHLTFNIDNELNYGITIDGLNDAKWYLIKSSEFNKIFKEVSENE